MTDDKKEREGRSDYLDTLLTEQQAAAFMKHQPRTLQKWRVQGIGPAYISISRRSVRYRRRDLLAFIDKCQCTSTSDINCYGGAA